METRDPLVGVELTPDRHQQYMNYASDVLKTMPHYPNLLLSDQKQVKAGVWAKGSQYL